MRMVEFNLITGNRFFTGPSDQEVAAEKFYNETDNIKSGVTNRFNDYQNPYGFGDISKNVEDTFGGYEDIINRDTAEEIAKQQGGAAASLASRGITGGSVLTDTQSGIASNINKSKTNALSNLGTQKAGMLSSLMEYFNNLKMGQTQAATNVDFGNISNLFQKYGLKGGAIGGLDSDTWLDDVFGGANAIGNLAQGIGSIASDIRLKENLKKVNEINGINIYEFNYIGDTKRFRGVIAQEVPQASIDVGGILFVDYSKLGIPFEEV